MDNLTVSNWIQILGIIASTLTAIVSAIIAIVAVIKTNEAAQENKKNIFNANRPYVIVYTNSIDSGMLNSHKYLIIKNFGKSAANVKSITSSEKIELAGKKEKEIFSLNSFVIAPGMVVKTSINRKFSETVQFNVSYSDLNNHEFTETHNVNFGLYDRMKLETTTKSDYSKDTNAIATAINIVAQQIQQK